MTTTTYERRPDGNEPDMKAYKVFYWLNSEFTFEIVKASSAIQAFEFVSNDMWYPTHDREIRCLSHARYYYDL